MVPPNPPAGALYGSIGSSGAMSWWHRWHTHGERGQSQWRIGQWWLIFCVLWTKTNGKTVHEMGADLKGAVAIIGEQRAHS